MSNLTDLTQRPIDLIEAKLPAAILPDADVTMADLDISVQRGRIFIAPTQEAYTQTDFNYYGHMEKSYTVLDLTDVFGTYDLRLLMNVPASSYDVAQKLADIFEVALTSDDVVYEVIPSIPAAGLVYLLNTASTSLMWKGQRSITLFPVTVS